MSDLAWEVIVILLPYMLVFSFLLFAPYFLGMGLWKLGIQGKAKNFKEFYQALQLVACSSVMFFLIFRVLLWSWKW